MGNLLKEYLVRKSYEIEYAENMRYSNNAALFRRGGKAPVQKFAAGGGVMSKVWQGVKNRKGTILGLGAAAGAAAGGLALYNSMNSGEAVVEGYNTVRIGVDYANQNIPMFKDVSSATLKFEFDGTETDSYSIDVSKSSATRVITSLGVLRGGRTTDGDMYTVDAAKCIQALKNIRDVDLMSVEDSQVLQEIINNLQTVIANQGKLTIDPTKLQYPYKYTVRRGDSWQSISDLFKQDINVIMFDNPHLEGRDVYPGDILTIRAYGSHANDPATLLNPGSSPVSPTSSPTTSPTSSPTSNPSAPGTPTKGKNMYQRMNQKRLTNKCARLNERIKSLKEKMDESDNPNQKERIRKRMVRAESRKAKACYKADNLYK